MTYTVGLDWAKDTHAVCVIDAEGAVVERFEVEHDRDGLRTFATRLKRWGLPETLRIAVERPSGLLVDTLVEAGFVIVPIHPNVVKACRSRYSTVHAKSDPGDAYLLADLLRTDGHRFEPLRPLSDEIRALRALVRGRDDLVAERVAVASQLRSRSRITEARPRKSGMGGCGLWTPTRTFATSRPASRARQISPARASRSWNEVRAAVSRTSRWATV